MTRFATGVLLILVGIVVGLFLHGKRLIPHLHILDDGDPPVTVGDSSFDGHSDFGFAYWDSGVLNPNGENSASGSLGTNCGLPNVGMVAFDDGSGSPNALTDISPPPNTTLNITIVHNGGQIIATTNTVNSSVKNLSLTDKGKGWQAPPWYTDTSANSNTTHITVVQYVKQDGSPGTIPAKGGKLNAHVRICYQ